MYFAERDEEDGTLITEGGRDERAGKRQTAARLRQAERLLPAPGQLSIPDEVKRTALYRRQPSWVLMFFQVWAKRGMKPDEIAARYFAKTRQSPSGGPKAPPARKRKRGSKRG